MPSAVVATLVAAIVALLAATLPGIAQNKPAAFDHAATGYALTGSHQGIECASCHVAGRFKTTPRQCEGCHNGSPIAGKTLTHPKTTAKCGNCHQTTRWSDIRLIDHFQATGACASCHNGSIAKAKPATHIPTTAQCETCHTSTASFAIAKKMDHTGITSGCATCHNNVTALGKPSKHVPTSQPCEACHFSTTTFAGTVYAHQPSDTNCTSCHNNSIARGTTTPPHIPVGQTQCSTCHSNASASFTVYTMNHAGVAGVRCDSCHNGAFASQGTTGAMGTRQYPNHVPTGGRDCVTCHAQAAASFTSWSGGTYVHQPSDQACSTCHNRTIAVGMTSPPHVPTGSTQCGNCHSSTASSFKTYSMNHAAVSGRRCDTCHNGAFTDQGTAGALGTAAYANHVVTGGRDCNTCHARAAASFSSWAGATYVHAVSDTNCSACHNGTSATGLTTPPHIPVTGIQCGNCHSSSAKDFTTYTMNHAAVAASRCDSCHNGSFTSQGSKGALGTASYPGHVPTGGRDCKTCHAGAATTFTTFAGASYSHQPSDTICSSCHNGTTATGKAASHVPAGTVECSNCHSSSAPSFTTYTMNHAAVSANRCDTCHNGSYVSQGTKGALGVAAYPGHIATGGQDCVTCHAGAASSYTSWAGGVYAHQAGDTNCASCHNGTAATGMSTPPHIPAAGIQCSNCHTSSAASFRSYTMNHASVSASRCDSCHNGSFTSQGSKGALGTSSYPGHVYPGGRDCNTCHASAAASFNSWSGGVYQHAVSDTGCTNCHNGLVATGMTTPPHIPTGALQCSNCHSNTAANFRTYTMNHSAVAGTRCDTCHNGSYTGEGTKGAQGTASYPGHVATSGRDCSSCHAAAAVSFSSWAGGLYSHLASDQNCSSCHNGTTATGKVTPPHIPTTYQCSGCHTNTASSFKTYSMNHAVVSASRCDSCHNGAFAGEGTLGALGTSSFPKHVATAGRDCVACHSATGFTSWAGGVYVHQATDTNCASCHNGTTAQGKTTPPHIPTASIQCSNCHSSSAASFTAYTMNHSAVSGSRCDSCHNGSFTGEGTKGALGTASYAGHVATSGQDCITCHTKASSGFVSWAGATYQHQPSDTNCSGCHNGTTATGKTTPPHIPTTAQCSSCHSSSAASFTVYTMNHAAVAGSRCDSCHNGSFTSQGNSGALGVASYSGHIATGGQDCITCHARAAVTFTSWAGGTYIHQPADTNCAGCHNGSTATGKSTPPHIPTTAQCSSCHSSTAASFTTYTMDHAAVAASRCDSCHNGSYTTEGAKGAQGTASYPNHVATGGQDCAACHASAAASFTSWAGGTYTHQAADTACSNCHNGKTALGMTAPPHIPSGSAQCGNCHSSSAASFTSYTMNHAAVATARCDSCHNGAYTSQGTKGALATSSYPNHVATNGWDCATCHASAAANFVSWAGGAYVHKPSDTNCSSCHNGTVALGMTTPPHIPSASVQCSNCHTNTAATFTTYVMQHAAVSSIRCDACHNGSFTTQGSRGAQGTASFANHVATAGRDCVVCHASSATNFSTWAGAKYQHQATDTNCSSCHNGSAATGMTTPPHIPSGTVQCSNCHSISATSFVSYTMNHSAVAASRCDSCHNGSFTAEGTKGAQGTASYAGHVATSGRDCISCHAAAASGGYVTWAGGVYTHQASDTNCSSCHNGTTATGKTTPPHIPTTAQCSNCHSSSAPTFITYTMNHGAVSGSRCDTCHNGSYTAEGTKGAQGTASYAGHVPTGGQDCVTCHATAAASYTSWAGGIYPHQASDTNCVGCHNGTTATGKTTPPHIPTTAQCSNCHSSSAASFITYTMNHAAVNASRCDSCHNGSYTSEGTKGAQGTASYPNHVAPAGRDCITCHASAAASFVSWAGGTYSHLPADTNCATCHNGRNAQGMATPPHIPSGAVQCSNCHTSSAASFATYTMNHGAVGGMRCDACHNGSYTGEGTKGAQGTASYPGHVAPAGRDCITCHASAAASFTAWSGGTYLHLATDTNCASCHNGSSAQGMTTPPHIPSGAVQCSNCHSSSAASFITYTMNHTSVSAMRCDACHNGSYTAEGTKGAQATTSYPNHVATGGRDCITCHAGAGANFTSWAGGTYAHLATDTNCSSCHNGTAAIGKTTPPHIPTTAQCSSCHTSAAVSFASYTMNHAAVSASRCDSCHNGSYTSQGTKGAQGTASYAGHIATGGRDCITCHAGAGVNFTSWAGGTYTHQATDTNCASCHNGTTATGLTTPPHIPTGTIQCSNCHVNTAPSFTTYTMNHSVVTGSRCDSCHNGAFTAEGTKGAYGTASYAGHVATSGRDCVTCHAKAVTSGYTSWTGGTYTHQAGDTNCSSCHNGTTATGKTTPPHIPTSTIQCSNCHVSTAASFTTYTMRHTAVTSIRCDACHNGAYRTQGTRGAQSKPSDHPRATQDCGCCHTSTVEWGPKQSAGTCTTTARTPVAARSVTSTIRSVLRKTVNSVTAVFRSGAPAKEPQPGSAAKNPVTTAAKVRAAPAPATAPAPVAAPRPPNNGAGSATSPKLSPVFLPPSTSPRIGYGSVVPPVSTTLAKPVPKVQTSGAGSVILRQSAALAVTPPVGTASPSATSRPVPTPVTGVGRPGVPTVADPHTRASASPRAGDPHARDPRGSSGRPFDHTGTSAPCASCHNGVSAVGKPGNHVVTTASCDQCHKSKVTFLGARFNHRSATTSCASCHNGRIAIGKTPKHFRTNAACDTCHKGTTSFTGAKIDHANQTAPCATCHNRTQAQARSARHFVTAQPCDTCHRSTTWSVTSYRHLSASYPNHRSTMACNSCHVGSTPAMAWKFPAFKPDCAGCHAADFKPAQHVKTQKPVPIFYTAAELRDCSGACHLYADKSATTIVTRRSGVHRASGRAW